MAVITDLQHTEIGVIPSDWQVRPIKSIAERIMVGIASAATHAYRPRGVVMFRNQNIKPGYLSDEDVLFIEEAFELSFKNKRLKGGDLLTARTGYPGTTAVVPDRYDGAQSFTTLITRPLGRFVNSDYLCFYINSAAGRKFFEQNQIGGGQKNVNAGSLRELLVVLPPKAEQQAIATALSDADAYIESLEQLITKKRQIKQGVMQELLTGKRRLPGFEGEWERRNLGDVCSITTGRKDVNEGHPQGVYPFFTCSRSHTFSNSFSFDMEAILIAGNGDVGNLHYFHGKFEAYQRTYVAYDFKINTQFMWHQLNYLLAKSLGLGKVGSSIPYIKRENLTQFSFPCPATIVEQVGIASVLTDLDYDISSHEGMLVKARYLKQAMMQQLLTGKIRLV